MGVYLSGPAPVDRPATPATKHDDCHACGTAEGPRHTEPREGMVLVLCDDFRACTARTPVVVW